MLTEILSIKEKNLAKELSKKMNIMRRQDESLSGSDVIIVQISTASTQLKVTAYKVVLVVEQAKPEGYKIKSAQQ